MGSSPSARYDPASDTTLLVPRCHDCDPIGYLIEGDVSSTAGRIHLRTNQATGWDVVPVEPIDYPGGGRTAVTAYAGPFEIVSPTPRLAALTAGPALALSGIALALRAPKYAVAVGGTAIAAALAVVATSADGGVGIVVVVFGFPPAVGLAGGLAWPRMTRRFWPLPLVAWACASWTFIQATPYFGFGQAI